MSEETNNLGYELYKMPEDLLPEGSFAMRLTEGEFTDVLFVIDDINVKEDPVTREGKFLFTYSLIKNPVWSKHTLTDEEAVRFENQVADLIIKTITKQVEETNEKVVDIE